MADHYCRITWVYNKTTVYLLSVLFLQCCRPCMIEYNPVPEGARCPTRVKYQFFCPPHGYVARAFTAVILMAMLWGICWAVLKEEALPGGNIFALIILFIFSNLGGYICTKIKLPPLLGKFMDNCLVEVKLLESTF